MNTPHLHPYRNGAYVQVVDNRTNTTPDTEPPIESNLDDAISEK